MRTLPISRAKFISIKEVPFDFGWAAKNSVRMNIIPSPRLLTGACLAIAALLTSGPAASAQIVIYRETFSTITNGQTLSAWDGGWSLWRSTSFGGNVTDATSVEGALSSANGRPTNLAPVNAGSYAQDVTGFVFGTTNSMREGLFFTSEYTWSAADLTSVSWFMGNGVTNATQRAALQVGSQWYVSAPFTSPAMFAAQFETQAVQQTVSSSDSWFPLVATLDAPFSIGVTATSLPTIGIVNSMGIYADTLASGNVRFDTYVINAVPEPSTYARLGLGALALLFLRRRRPAA